MLLEIPDFYKSFSCIASACPHSCCIGWDVEIDPETAAFYRTAPGALGDELRAVLQSDGEGSFFALAGGRCPFLNGQNLCRVHLAFGPEHTSETCRMHPRFWDEYGPLRSLWLSPSCPEIARLLTASDEPLTFLKEKTDEPETVCPDVELPLLRQLEACRETARRLLLDRSRPFPHRAALLLALASDIQDLLDGGTDALSEVCARYDDPAYPARLLPRLSRAAQPGGAAEMLRFLSGLEHTEPAWPQRLEAALGRGTDGAYLSAFPDPALERILYYYVNRGFLQADFDRDLLSKAEFAVLACCASAWLAEAPTRASLSEGLRLFAREIDHSDENPDLLTEAFCEDEVFDLSRFLGLLL